MPCTVVTLIPYFLTPKLLLYGGEKYVIRGAHVQTASEIKAAHVLVHLFLKSCTRETWERV